MQSYAPNMEGVAPTWLYVYCALGLVAYMFLDALDGKQARRTGSSSPLGLLFDHGCDALNTCLSGMTLASALQLGASWKTLLICGSTMFTFFAATWEEYYTGELILPPINGPNEGVLLTATFHLITAVMGPAFWTRTNFLGWQNNSIVLAMTLFSAVVTILINVRNVVRVNYASKSCVGVLIALSRWVPITLVSSFVAAWAYYSPAHVFQSHPRLVIWVLTLIFCKMVTSLMLAHLCDEEYRPYGKTVVLFLFRAYHCIFNYISGRPFFIDEATVLRELLVIAAVSYGHLVASAIYEITKILNINVFTIDTVKAYNMIAAENAKLEEQRQAQTESQSQPQSPAPALRAPHPPAAGADETGSEEEVAPASTAVRGRSRKSVSSSSLSSAISSSPSRSRKRSASVGRAARASSASKSSSSSKAVAAVKSPSRSRSRSGTRGARS